MGRRTAVLYLIATAVSALAAGALLDLFFKVEITSAAAHMHELLPHWLKLGSAVLLVALLAHALLKPMLHRHRLTQAAPTDRTHTLAVSGMTCSHCVETVEQAILACPGVTRAEVTLKPPRAVVSGTDFDVGRIRRAVEDAGYEIQ